MRIAIVNDMKLACTALSRVIRSEPRHSIAWVACDGLEAIENARRDRPDLILMDLIMPRVDGVEATRRIMAASPCPILVVTSTVSGNISKVYEAMGLGALDAVETPTLGAHGEMQGASSLLGKIAKIERLTEKDPTPTARRCGWTARPAAVDARTVPRLVLLGASTGGPKVLAEILNGLPTDLDAAVVLAQHVDEAYASGLARWLNDHSALPVQMAAAGGELRATQVYVASSTQHLEIGPDRRLHYVHEPAGWYRPSVDSLFQSAARNWPRPGVAALLTGMGRDGAVGLLALREAGWTTIAQDQESSVVWGMPKAAIDAGAAQHILPARRILACILTALHPNPSVTPTSTR